MSARPRRLLSVLGRGIKLETPFYESAVYGLDGETLGGATPLVQAALCRSQQLAISRVSLLVTAGARARWEGALLDEYLPVVSGESHAVERELVDIPDGQTPDEQWKILKTIVELLDRAREDEEEVIVDVTHGFRILPMLVIAAVNFARARWKMRDAHSDSPQEQPDVRILYGAFGAPANAEGATPIWNLTSILGTADWADALRAFLSFGRADDLCDVVGREVKSLQLEGPARGALTNVGKFAKEAADDLVTVRLQNLLERSVAQLVDKAISGERLKPFKEARPLLHGTLSEFASVLGELRIREGSGLGSREGIRASLRLAALLGRMQRYSEQSAVLRETAVTLYALWEGHDTGLHSGRKPKPSRKAADNIIGKAANRAGRGSPARGDVLADTIAKVRNDVQHAGMNSDYASSASLRKGLEDIQVSLEAQLKELNDEPPKAAVIPAPLLVNLSNRPVASWLPAQLDEAKHIGPVVDLGGGMPEIDPALSPKEIGDLAKSVARRACDQGATAAAVFGEPVFTSHLVDALERDGVLCWAPAGRRQVISERSEGRELHEQRSFEFVCWRRYRCDD